MAEGREESELSDLKETVDEQSDKNAEKKGKAKKGKRKGKKQGEVSVDEDEELSNLLDSALENFGKVENPNQEQACKVDPPNSLWNEEFLFQTAEKLREMNNSFSAGDTPMSAEELGENLQSFAEALTQIGGELSPDAEFSQFFAQSLKQLSETEPSRNKISDDDIKNMMSNLNSCLESSEIGKVFPMLFTMMQNLLSKEVLYSDLKSIVDKYPGWMDDNKEKLSSFEYERHSNMLTTLKDVCLELEKEKPEDTEDVKKERCDRIINLMLKVQDLGLIPPEIAGDLSPILAMDSQGNPEVAQNMSPNQCVIA